MRTLVAILVVVAQLAGPWVCCCNATGRTTPARSDTTTPVLPTPKAGCCPHCLPELPAEPTPAPTPAKVPEPCPCGGTVVPAVRAAEPVLTTAADGLLVPVSTEPTSPLLAVPFDAPTVAGLRELPWLTTSDRLFAHHVLRC